MLRLIQFLFLCVGVSLSVPLFFHFSFAVPFLFGVLCVLFLSPFLVGHIAFFLRGDVAKEKRYLLQIKWVFNSW